MSLPEAVRTVSKLPVNGKRGIEIGEAFGDHRNTVIALGGECLEFRLQHDVLRLQQRRRQTVLDTVRPLGFRSVRVR